MGSNHADVGDPAPCPDGNVGIIDSSATRGKRGADGGTTERVINAFVWVILTPHFRAKGKTSGVILYATRPVRNNNLAIDWIPCRWLAWFCRWSRSNSRASW